MMAMSPIRSVRSLLMRFVVAIGLLSINGGPLHAQAIPGTADSLSELASELEMLRRQTQNLREEQAKAKKAANEFSAKEKQADERLKMMTEEIPHLKKWQQGTFVLGDERQPSPVLVREEGGRLVLLDTATPKTSAARVAAARNASIPRITAAGSSKLAAEIVSQVPIGETINSSLSQEIRKSFWFKRNFLSELGEAASASPRYVVYRDPQFLKQKIGLVKNVGPDALEHLPVGKRTKVVNRADVLTGSARAGHGNDILDAVDEEDTFFDFCILAIANELTVQGHSDMSVALHFTLDAVEGSLKELHRIEKLKFKGIDWNNTIIASGGKSAISLWNGGGLQFEPVSKEWEEIVPIEDPNKALKELARKIEDSLYDKMAAIGLPVVEREYFNEVLKLRPKPTLTSDVSPMTSAADRANASHLIIASIDSLTKEGRYRISMRLIDVRSKSANVLWSVNSTPTYRQPRAIDQNAIFLKSGVLATIESRPRPGLPMPDGFEGPLKVEFTHEKKVANLPKRQLVVLESSTDEENVLYRPLFSREIRSTPADYVRVTPFTKGVSEIIAEANKPDQQDDSLEEQLFRAIVWELATKKGGLTLAGRISKVTPGGNGRPEYEVSIGRDAGLIAGNDPQQVSQLRVYRPVQNQNGVDKHSDLPLPIALRVKDVRETTAIATQAHYGLPGFWDEAELAPKVGDIVYNPYEPIKKMVVYPPQDKSDDLPQTEKNKVYGGDPYKLKGKELNELLSRRTKILQRQYAIADQIQKKLRDGFTNINALAYDAKGDYSKGRLDVIKTCTDARQRGATHFIGGYIKPVKENDPKDKKYKVGYKVTLEIFELEPHPTIKDAWHHGGPRTSIDLATIFDNAIE